ncbi:hypothetical protein HNQ79_002884 [Streptomyces candidus]|uniref:Uncharacterized protein n=1 Tax=Streptomyces candidus TaxID=67283 RepID=A0A7X0HEZ6_9ACTN|nr:hypothetical protein [Streptomyces candidus]
MGRGRGAWVTRKDGAGRLSPVADLRSTSPAPRTPPRAPRPARE